MMEEYFIPQIEDIRIGYECELLRNVNVLTLTPTNYPPEYKTFIFKKNNIHLLHDLYPAIRTPYLSKEQIEAEGWKVGYLHNNGFYVHYDEKNRTMHINDYNGDTYFNGECKDINTFRYICKLLKIN